MRPILVLRPEPGATATVERARELGLQAIAVPLFEIGPIAWALPEGGRFDALLLTSANAVRHGGMELRRLRHLPVYAVGGATAQAAREAGFNVAASGDGGIDPLLAAIPAAAKLLHLCGADRKVPTVAAHEITPVPVYRAVERPEPGLDGSSESVALIHSPRAGRRFAELILDRARIAVAAISAAAAEAVGTGWEIVETAHEPSDEALLALATRLCNKPARQ